MGDTGSVITPFYDSLLVKVTAFGPKLEIALQRMDRALREFRIRGVKTNIPFLENVIHNPTFRSGAATTSLIDTTPALFEFKGRRDRATKLLTYLGDVIVNGNPQAKGRRVRPIPAFGGEPADAGPRPRLRPPPGPAARHARPALAARPARSLPSGSSRRSACSSPTPPFATPTSPSWPRACAPMTCWRWPTPLARRTPAPLLPRNAGAARPSTPPCASCTKIRTSASRCCANGSPTSASRCCFAAPTPSATPTTRPMSSRGFVRHAAAMRHRSLPHLRFAQLPAEPARWPWKRSRKTHAHLRGRHLLHRRHARPGAATNTPQATTSGWPGN